VTSFVTNYKNKQALVIIYVFAREDYLHVHLQSTEKRIQAPFQSHRGRQRQLRAAKESDLANHKYQK